MNLIYYLFFYLILENEQEVMDAGILFILTTYLYSTTLPSRNFMTSAGLQDPSLTSGQHLYLNGTDSDYMSVIGIDRATISYILHSFSKFYAVISAEKQ